MNRYWRIIDRLADNYDAERIMAIARRMSFWKQIVVILFLLVMVIWIGISLLALKAWNKARGRTKRLQPNTTASMELT